LRFTGCGHPEKFPFLTASPGIFDAQASIDMLNVVFHWEGEIALSVKRSSNESNRTARHKLADENDTASPGVSRLSPHVETQIHFFEVAMQRDRKTQETGIEKEKSDNANERLAVFIIDLGAGRNQRFNQNRIDDVIQYRQITPVSGEEWFHAADMAVTERGYRINR